MAKILLIDNYDSFTWNLVHLIGGLGHDVEVQRNDAITVAQALERKASAIVLSPGPCTPDQAGICVELVREALPAGQPMFGVCLGLQSMAQALGGKVTPAKKLMHGKVSSVSCDQHSFLGAIPEQITVTRYHSLVADAQTLPADLRVIARADDDKEIMAIEHVSAPIAAVQYHPESIASEAGAALFAGYMQWASDRSTQDGKAKRTHV